MSFFVGVDREDAANLGNLRLPLPLGVMDVRGDSVTATVNGERLPEHGLYPGLLLGIGVTQRGLQRLRETAEKVSKRFACRAPLVADLTAEEPARRQAAILASIVEAQTQALRSQAERNVQLTRALATVRQAHEQTQASFAQLERYVFSNDLARRNQCLGLRPAAGPRTVLLGAGVRLTQRLPVSSAGLSDIAIFVDHVAFPDSGELQVDLTTIEDNALVGRWSVPARGLTRDAIRLSLPISLSADDMTPELTITWNGNGDIGIATALFHPDPRFQFHLGDMPQGKVIACLAWNYIPGCEAAIPTGAILPSSRKPAWPQKRMLDADLLGGAVNLVHGAPESEHFKVLPEIDGIQVHPPGKGMSAALLPGALPAGTTQVRARIMTRAKAGPDIEYAMALAPSARRATSVDNLPSFRPWAFAGWSCLHAFERSDLFLTVEMPLAEPHDLYLMTRLPMGQHDASWGWATFSHISVDMAVG